LRGVADTVLYSHLTVFVYKWVESDNAQLLEWPVTADCLNCNPKEEMFGMECRKFGY